MAKELWQLTSKLLPAFRVKMLLQFSDATPDPRCHRSTSFRSRNAVCNWIDVAGERIPAHEQGLEGCSTATTKGIQNNIARLRNAVHPDFDKRLREHREIGTKSVKTMSQH